MRTKKERRRIIASESSSDDENIELRPPPILHYLSPGKHDNEAIPESPYLEQDSPSIFLNSDGMQRMKQ